MWVLDRRSLFRVLNYLNYFQLDNLEIRRSLFVVMARILMLTIREFDDGDENIIEMLDLSQAKRPLATQRRLSIETNFGYSTSGNIGKQIVLSPDVVRALCFSMKLFLSTCPLLLFYQTQTNLESGQETIEFYPPPTMVTISKRSPS